MMSLAKDMTFTLHHDIININWNEMNYMNTRKHLHMYSHIVSHNNDPRNIK